MEDKAIDYWAHMLDEAFGERELGDRSYYAVWLKEHPQFKPASASMRKYLIGLFDRRIAGIKDIDAKLKKFVAAWKANAKFIPYEQCEKSLLAAFDPDELTDRNYFWEPISAQTYKAVISRHRAATQGQLSRNVSPDTLKDCLDSICRSASVLVTNPEIWANRDMPRTQTYMRLQRIWKGDKEELEYMARALYVAVSAFCTYENEVEFQKVHNEFKKKYAGKNDQDRLDRYFDEWNTMQDKAVMQHGVGDWLTNQSDGEIGEDIIDELKRTPYDVYERPDDAVPLISRLVDKAHIRGDVAGAFVEGGAPTCAAVSNMAPDELYECGK